MFKREQGKEAAGEHCVMGRNAVDGWETCLCSHTDGRRDLERLVAKQAQRDVEKIHAV